MKKKLVLLVAAAIIAPILWVEAENRVKYISAKHSLESYGIRLACFDSRREILNTVEFIYSFYPSRPEMEKAANLIVGRLILSSNCYDDVVGKMFGP